MRKKIAKMFRIFAIIGAILIVLSDFVGEYGYIPFWIGVVVLVFSGIAYFATGEEPREWFWNMLDWF